MVELNMTNVGIDMRIYRGKRADREWQAVRSGRRGGA
jgi:hypothetical protein